MREDIYRLPSVFLAKFQKLYPACATALLDTFLREKSSSFRINYLKTDLVSLRRAFIKERVRFKELAFPKGASILNDSLKDFQKTAIYRQGLVYVQNVSSMIPPLALAPTDSDSVLDLCAAPGAKTTQMISLAPRAEFVAVEKARIRYYKLLANLTGQGVRYIRPPDRIDLPADIHERDDDEEQTDQDGAPEPLKEPQDEVVEGCPACRQAGPRITVYLMDGIWVRKKFPDYFSKILLDAPCSAEGRFYAFNPRTFKYWKERKVHEMVHTQKKLINAAFYALREGGQMVYSTCTFSPEENEGVVNWFLNKYKGQMELMPIDLPLVNACQGFKAYDKVKYSDEMALTRRILPNDYLEGFFIAKLRKI